MLVKDLMTTDVVTVKGDNKVSEIADLLHKRGFTGVPVVNDEGTVLGIITERELFSADSKLYLPGYMKILQETKFLIGGHRELPYAAEQLTRTAAKDIMNRNVHFVSPNTTIDELAELLVKDNQSPLPVTDASNKLLGIISRSDLIKLLVPQAPIHDDSYYTKLNASPKTRPIDDELSYVHKDLSSRFAYVAKAKANVWLTTLIVLFVVGFLIGVVYVANPDILFGPNAVPAKTTHY